MGKSLIVVGDSSTVRVHIHTLKPDKVTRFAASFGSLVDIDIRNMDEQHVEFLLVQKERKTKLETAFVTVTNGDGLADVFSKLGVAAIVPGGQAMNPSTMDILQAVEAVPADKVIILPNNKNIILTAQQVPALTKKTIRVIPTETVPQGITALIAFNPEADLDTNTRQMTEAGTTVKTIEVTRATRDSRVNGLSIKKGQAIGLLDGKLLAADDKPENVVLELLSQINDLANAAVVTIYYGNDTGQADADQLSAEIRRRYPSLEVGAIHGDQPYYDYIISIE